MKIRDLAKRLRSSRRVLREAHDEVNTPKNLRKAYEFIQAMNGTNEKLGHGYISHLEVTSKGTIRAVIPWWGDHGDGIYYFSHKVLESEEYRQSRLSAMRFKKLVKLTS